MTKFENELAERLYGESPDDEIGSSVDGDSWWGLYLAYDPDDSGEWVTPPAILRETTQGFVDVITFESDEDAEDGWQKLEGEYAAFWNRDDTMGG